MDISKKCTAYICRIEEDAEQESKLHGVTSQKILFFIVTTENLRSYKVIVCGEAISMERPQVPRKKFI
jgi:hypothetical protein